MSASNGAALPKRDGATEPPPVGKAAFLGGLLAFVSAVAFSVVGVGHSRSLEGDANIQYWVVVALVAGALAVVTAALARTMARSRLGEVARRAAVALAAVGLVLFVWETVALGFGAEAGPVSYAIHLFAR
ncbi:MAG TPA: hypothetical protein VGC51_08015 [Hansschlegelia sp.]